MFQDREFIILGNQKWQGASANFIIKLIVNRIDEKGEYRAREAVKRRPEAKAWIIKYLMAASFSWLMLDCRRRGIKEYMLISRPIQTTNQLLEVTEIKVPRRSVV